MGLEEAAAVSAACQPLSPPFLEKVGVVALGDMPQAWKAVSPFHRLGFGYDLLDQPSESDAVPPLRDFLSAKTLERLQGVEGFQVLVSADVKEERELEEQGQLDGEAVAAALLELSNAGPH